ncbi:hypothetical protein [Actinoplanes xinjiangensis]|uniref:hypothetical protein n=1 Tax=Actinoplanes xinjiangensis TaxID=512350 RepID=UPI00342047EA
MTAERVLVASSPPELEPNFEHAADRSSWDCRVCGQPWPCAPAKVTLKEDFREQRSSLLVFLVSTFYEAVDSYAGRGAPADLYGRFVIWAVRTVNP